jgi:hypothetical protein
MNSRIKSDVDAWRLETQFLPNGEKRHDQNSMSDEVWRPTEQLGHGTYGEVWKETCISGRSLNSVRAVKRISQHHLRYLKSFERELDALITFSDRRVPQVCLGKADMADGDRNLRRGSFEITSSNAWDGLKTGIIFTSPWSISVTGILTIT